MHQRDPRPTYSYDDQNTAYTGHVSHHSEEYTPTGYQQYDGTHYYAAPTHTMGGVNNCVCHLSITCFLCLLMSHVDTNQPNPYVRSMTPSLVPTQRYPNPNPNPNRDARYINSHSVAASSSNSSIGQPVYEPQNQYYNAPYTHSEYRTPISNHSHPRIPTPSEIANSYSNYPHHMTTPQSPTIPEDPYTSSSVDYPAPPRTFPSSQAQGTHGHRPRIVTGRPRTASAAGSTSPTSASSPSGERFPCDKCGKTFSRSHDRKRHHETQHLILPKHSCKYCEKEFSR